MIEIKHRDTGAVIFSSETAESLREAVIEAAQKELNLSGANLSRADLSRANLSGAYLSEADLSEADLSGAYLSGAYLSRADLSRANLSGAYLSRANLSGAYLSRANLSEADLSRAYLSEADLSRANLSGANLSGIRDDVWTVLDCAQSEVVGLLEAIRDGRIDGSVYNGECACLVGTIAKIRNCSVSALEGGCVPDSSRPAERWFLALSPGDTPENNPVSRLTAQWVEEWLTKNDVEVPELVSVTDARAFAKDQAEAFRTWKAAQ